MKISAIHRAVYHAVYHAVYSWHIAIHLCTYLNRPVKISTEYMTMEISQLNTKVLSQRAVTLYHINDHIQHGITDAKIGFQKRN